MYTPDFRIAIEADPVRAGIAIEADPVRAGIAIETGHDPRGIASERPARRDRW